MATDTVCSLRAHAARELHVCDSQGISNPMAQFAQDRSSETEAPAPSLSHPAKLPGLQPGETIDVEPGSWVYREESVGYTQQVFGLKTGILGGGGNLVFNRFTGPGRVWLQSGYYTGEAAVAGAAAGGAVGGVRGAVGGGLLGGALGGMFGGGN